MAILPEEVDSTSSSKGQCDELVTSVGTEGVDEAVFWFSVTRVTVFAEQRKYKPGPDVLAG